VGLCSHYYLWGIEKLTPIMTKNADSQRASVGVEYFATLILRTLPPRIWFILVPIKILNLLVGNNSVSVSSHSYHELSLHWLFLRFLLIFFQRVMLFIILLNLDKVTLKISI
jgi:hypothetical protein